MSSRTLWAIILIEGFVTLSVEILTIRQLLPFVGNSVLVTSIIIGIFLLFLAYGYLHGGKHSENLTGKLRTNFIVAAILITVGLSYSFLTLIFDYGRILHLSPYVTLVLYLLSITAPLVFVLGQTVPITVNLIKSTQTKGAISGKVLHINTIGSFLGSIITTVVLMNYFGVAQTISFTVLLVVILILSVTNFNSQNIPILFLSLAVLPSSYYLNNATEKMFFVKTNAYSNYQVLTDVKIKSSSGKLKQKGNLLIVNNSMSSFVENNSKAGFTYIEKIKHILFNELKFHNKNILVLGAGAFSLTNSGDHGNHVTYVDIDNDIRQVSKQYMHDTINGYFKSDDARTYMNENTAKYDAIISDAFSNHSSVPAHLMTKEYLAKIHETLSEDGVAILNIIADPRLQDNYSKRVDNTIRSVFHNCMSHPLSYSNKNANILYVCFRQENTSNMIYTDDLNPITIDSLML